MRMHCNRNNLVDPPGEENPENPELAISKHWRKAGRDNTPDVFQVSSKSVQGF